MRIKTGIPGLDNLLLSGGIITLRSNSRNWLSHLAANMIVRSYNDAAKTSTEPETEHRQPNILYLHFVDYHKRYWTIDADRIMELAKREGKDFNSIAENLYFLRAFSRDNAENEENWEMITGFADNLNLVLLDTLSDLYHLQKKRPIFQKTFAYVLGRFARICMKNDCPGIILDDSSLPVHPFLGDVSSTIIEFHVSGRIRLHLIKHPCLSVQPFYLQLSNQRTLGGWM